MSTAGETRKKNAMLATIIEWQEEREPKLETWNQDQLRYEIGLDITEHVEEFIIRPTQPEDTLEVEFEDTDTENEYKFKHYTLKEVEEGQYTLTYDAPPPPKEEDKNE